jgi:hypothetical protein
MTSIVLVRLIVDIDSEKGTPSTLVIAESIRNFYNPEILDELIKEVLNSALNTKYAINLPDLSKQKPEIGISIKSNEGIRLSFHLTHETLSLINTAGASIDFDPYIF